MPISAEAKKPLLRARAIRENPDVPVEDELTRGRMHDDGLVESLATELQAVADAITSLILQQRSTGDQTEVQVVDQGARQLLGSLVTQQKITNLHMAIITDTMIEPCDVE